MIYIIIMNRNLEPPTRKCNTLTLIINQKQRPLKAIFLKNVTKGGKEKKQNQKKNNNKQFTPRRPFPKPVSITMDDVVGIERVSESPRQVPPPCVTGRARASGRRKCRSRIFGSGDSEPEVLHGERQDCNSN